MGATDTDLLREYAQGSEAAFATLVERHLNLVYSAARRQVRSPQLAEEVAQSVFSDLARRAATFPRGTPLNGWLYLVTRRTAIDTMRRESRRLAREQAAAELAPMHSMPSAWSRVEPLLDEAMSALSASDRHAILLRFFENKNLRDIGAALGTSDDAAQKRVSRALDQLRAFFLRRGITITAAGLATDLSAHALHAAPAGLGSSVTAAVVSLATQAALPTTATVVAMTTLEKSLITCALIAALGGVVFEAGTLRAQRNELAGLRQRIDALSSEARQTRQQRDLAIRHTEEAQQRLAAQLDSARSPADLAAETEMKAWMDRVSQLRQLSSQRPDLAIPELKLLPDDDWFRTARALQVETEDQVRDTFATLRHRAENAFINQLRRALRSYLDGHDGTLPENSRELAPFFDPPIEPAALDRYQMVARGKVADLRRDTVIKQESPLDLERDTVWEFGLNELSSQSGFGFHVRRAVQAFTQANQGAKPTRPEDIQSYLPWTVHPGKLQPYLNYAR